jgi:putative ABC transport system permease protein
MNNIFKIVQYILAGFGLIALGVASIGMFNTLTISLLERTREIGIMRVLGATGSDIMKIFLIEAIFMGFGGGAFGLVTGWLITFILNTTVANLANSLGGQPTYPFLTPWYFAVGIMAVSLIIGFVTGLYPAKHASKLNPLDALRYE